MKKSHIVNNIEKYFLNGLTKEVVWDIKDGKVIIDFTTEASDTIGQVIFNLDLPDTRIGIYNTDSLLRLLGITSEDITVELGKGGTGLIDKLKIQDNKFDLEYHLSDISVIKAVKTVREIDYDFTFEIGSELITGFLKSHNALEKTNEVTFNTATTKQGENVVEIILGERSPHANKIKFTEPANFTSQSDTLPFAASVLREILSANKNSKGTMSISNQGLAKIEFESEEGYAKYFIVKTSTGY